jgi:hypothetical protein
MKKRERKRKEAGARMTFPPPFSLLNLGNE